MAKEYIERGVAIEKTETFCDVFVTNWTDEKVLAWIKNLPAADVVEVVHAQWEIEMDDMGWNKHTCPNCGYVKRTDIHVSLGWNFCPNCGAKMDGGADK